MRLIPNFSFFTASWASFGTTIRLLSSVQIKESVLPSTSKDMILSSGTTMGRMFKLWGATGVITKLPLSGKTIGPLQLKE